MPQLTARKEFSSRSGVAGGDPGEAQKYLRVEKIELIVRESQVSRNLESRGWKKIKVYSERTRKPVEGFSSSPESISAHLWEKSTQGERSDHWIGAGRMISSPHRGQPE